MGFAALFLNKKPTFCPGGLDVLTPKPIVFDATIADSHDVRFAWTGSPIENGQFATDHGIELPVRVTMEVAATVHTDTVIPNVVSTRHIRLYRQLRDLARRREPFDLVTSLAVYTSMVIDRVGVPRRGPASTFALMIPVEMHKIEIATIDLVQNMAEIATEIALGEQDIGAIAAAAETAVPGV